MARKLAAVMFLLGVLQAAPALSVGLGAMQVQSFLNEPFKASIDLLDMGGLHEDEVKIRLASRDDFEKIGLDRPYFLTNIAFEVFARDNGTARILVTSDQPVLEPYLDFIVEARWPSGRLLREYTVFIDPPSFAEINTVAVSAGQLVDEVALMSVPIQKSDDVITTGTTVEIRRTELAPDAMPQRGYNASTAVMPQAGSRYMISRQDTLWRIASLAKPPGATVQQTMLDIQRLNPDAFVSGNINLIKAGYIVYLPGASDISTADARSALAEVRQQNAAWRDGKDTTLKPVSAPSLTISTDSDDTAVAAAMTVNDDVTGSAAVDSEPLPAVNGNDNGAESGSPLVNDMRERLFAAEQQLETLQLIVSLKDEQIAALQSALAAADAAAATDTVDADVAAAGAASKTPVDPDQLPNEQTPDDANSDAIAKSTEVAKPGTDSVQEALLSEKPKVTSIAAVTTNASDESGLTDLWYLLAVIAVGAVAFVAVRRRKLQRETASYASNAQPLDDIFSAVELEDQGLNVEESEVDDDMGSFSFSEDGLDAVETYNHDEPSPRTEAEDVLADVEIYLVYGRQSQAIDLLTNAIASDSNNPVYRRKLMEIEAQRNHHLAVGSPMRPAAKTGDADSDAQTRPEASLEGGGATDRAPGLSANPLELMVGDVNDVDLDGLEIGGLRLVQEEEDELDFAGNFALQNAADSDNNELLITADGYGLTTKLDLARAYIDMGDDDGAREILQEVVAEGTNELKAEAIALLDRIGQ